MTFSRCDLRLGLSIGRFLCFKNIGFKHNRLLSISCTLKFLEAAKIKESKQCTLNSQSLENLFFHKVLENRDGCYVVNVSNFESDVLGGKSELDLHDLLLGTDFNKTTPDKLCSIYKLASIDSATKSLLPFSHEIYNKLSLAIVDNLKTFSDDQICTIMLYTSIWPLSDSTRANNFMTLWKTLDFECIERWREWSNDKILYFIDLWYLIKLTRISDFCFYSLTNLGKKYYRLTGPQLIQLLFYYNTVRTISKGINLYNIEYRLEECINQMSINDIGIASLGFFKTQSKLQSHDLMKYIIQKTISEVETINEITLASILKCLRLSLPIPLWNELPHLLDAVTPQLGRLSIPCSIHVTYVTSPSLVLHKPSLDAVSQKIIDNLEMIRLKDMEKVILSLSQLNYNPQTSTCIFTEVTNELRKPSRQNEIKLFPRSFIALIHFLCLQSHIPHDLISSILNMDFIIATYGKNRYRFGRELLTIDTAVEIESSNYSGHRLPADVRNYLFKRYSQFLPNNDVKMSKHAAFTDKLKKTAESILGNGCVKYVYILPSHPRADIVYQTNKYGHAVPLPDDFLSLEDFGGIVKAPSNGNQWHALIPATRNMFLYNSSEPNGETASKLRCLSILGFQPHMVRLSTWPEENKDGEKLLRNTIFQ